MSLESLISSLETHWKHFPEEKSYVDRMIDFLRNNNEKSFHNHHWDDGHITASMLIVNHERTKVLLIFHKKLKRWLQFGGHSDDSPDVLATAIREFHEESGIGEDPKILSFKASGELPIFDLDIHSIPSDLKGRPAHLHYDVRFLWSISEDVPLAHQAEEVDDIRWFDIDGVEKYIEEKNLMRMIGKIKNLP